MTEAIAAPTIIVRSRRIRAILVGGPYDCTKCYKGPTHGVQLDLIDANLIPEELVYNENSATERLVYKRCLQDTESGKVGGDDVVLYVLDTLSFAEALHLLAKSYGRYERFLGSIRHKVQFEDERNASMR